MFSIFAVGHTNKTIMKQCNKEDKGEIGKDDGGVRSQTITKTVDSNHKGRFASNKKGTSSPTTTTLTLADFFKMHQNNPEMQAIT